jgi:HD-GYP domain-containing protein (c-di-GMP phosphodiesterase class II)
VVDISGIMDKYKNDKSKSSSSDASPAADHKPDLSQLKPFSSATGKELYTEPPNEAVNNLLKDALKIAKQVYKTDPDSRTDLLDSVSDIIKDLVSSLVSSKKDLMRGCCAEYPDNDFYIYRHAVNVSIISLELGRGLEYDQARLLGLGVGAFLLDIGLVKYAGLINRPEKLSPESRMEIQEHPEIGLRIAKEIAKDADSDILFSIIRQHHERIDGSGYPHSLKGDQITEPAQITGLADIYEAMIHKRPYRESFTPLEAVRNILNRKDAIDTRLIKILLQRIGVFPIGTYVRLNTKEIGVVTDENRDSPLCPVVNVLLDQDRKELKQPKTVNLADSRGVMYIEDCITY